MGYTRGPNKIEVICPKCGKQQEILWFCWSCQSYRITGSTGFPTKKIEKKAEKVEGVCECGYKFKPKDLDSL